MKTEINFLFLDFCEQAKQEIFGQVTNFYTVHRQQDRIDSVAWDVYQHWNLVLYPHRVEVTAWQVFIWYI